MGLCASNIQKDTGAAEVATLPYGYETIIRDADSPIDRSSTEKIYDQLYSGIYLNGWKQKYWIQRGSNLNCFAIFPRNFYVVWGWDNRYWGWPTCEDEGDDNIQMAELQSVCYFLVSGNFDISKLSPGTTYEIVYILELTDDAKGWEVPISVEFNARGIESKQHDSLHTKPRDQWTELHVGEFETSSDPTIDGAGDISFSIAGTEGLYWKDGLTIKCVVIRPKENLP